MNRRRLLSAPLLAAPWLTPSLLMTACAPMPTTPGPSPSPQQPPLAEGRQRCDLHGPGLLAPVRGWPYLPPGHRASSTAWPLVLAGIAPVCGHGHPGVGHDAWTAAWDDPGLWPWLMALPRLPAARGLTA